MSLVPMAVAAAPSGMADLLIKGLLVFFFIVVPIIRSVREARRKQREAQARRAEAPGGDEDAEKAAKQRWEELLRGEAAAPAPAPMPVPVSKRADVADPAVLAEIEEEAGPDEESEPALSKSLTMLPNASVESAPPAAASRTFAEERIERRAAETRRRESFERPNVEAPTQESARAAMAPMAAFDEVERGRVLRQAGHRTELLGHGGNRRAALQRAIVAMEVLGRPVGMRSGSEELGPLALRR